MTIKIILITLLILFILSVLISNFWVKVTIIKIKTHKIAKKYRILHLADIHLQYDWMSKCIRILKTQKFDLIVINGDVLKEKIIYRDIRKLERKLKKLVLFNIPIFFVMGNHELEHQDNLKYIKSIMPKIGIKILEGGKSYNYEELKLTALDFFYMISEKEKKKQIEKINKLKEENYYKILISHTTPHNEINNNEIQNNIIDLCLSGHTHGGVVTIPFIGAIKLPDEPINSNRKYSYGLHKFKNTLLYISRGCGHGEYYYIRGIYNPREINIIEIMPK